MTLITFKDNNFNEHQTHTQVKCVQIAGIASAGAASSKVQPIDNQQVPHFKVR